MNIKPIAGPLQQSAGESQTQVAAKARAVQAASGNTPAPQIQFNSELPQVNPNSVSPEELSAVRPTRGQNHSNVDQPQEAILEAGDEGPQVPKPTPPPAQDPETTKRFAQLARQEKQLRMKAQAQEQSLKAREDALKVREAELATKSPDLTAYIPADRVKNDPLSVLAEAGVSYEELTQQIISQQPVDPRLQATINRLEAKIKDMEKSAEDGRKTYEQQQQDSYNIAINQMRSDAQDLINSDPEFDTIKALNRTNDVVDLIVEVHKRDKIVMSVEEAARRVEDYLVDSSFKASQLSKVQKRMAANRQANANTQVQQPQTPVQAQPTRMKTLTNAAASTKPLSVRDRAIAAMEGRLK